MPRGKSGHLPAFQNSYAFKHNPNSKKTAKILAMPISGVCQRCRDKLEWRKKYRKYKPLTQPSVCNFCRERNVNAAYHQVIIISLRIYLLIVIRLVNLARLVETFVLCVYMV